MQQLVKKLTSRHARPGASWERTSYSACLATAGALPGATLCEPKSNPQINTTDTGLGGASRVQSAN